MSKYFLTLFSSGLCIGITPTASFAGDSEKPLNVYWKAECEGPPSDTGAKTWIRYSLSRYNKTPYFLDLEFSNRGVKEEGIQATFRYPVDRFMDYRHVRLKRPDEISLELKTDVLGKMGWLELKLSRISSMESLSEKNLTCRLSPTQR